MCNLLVICSMHTRIYNDRISKVTHFNEQEDN